MQPWVGVCTDRITYFWSGHDWIPGSLAEILFVGCEQGADYSVSCLNVTKWMCKFVFHVIIPLSPMFQDFFFCCTIGNSSPFSFKRHPNWHHLSWDLLFKCLCAFGAFGVFFMIINLLLSLFIDFSDSLSQVMLLNCEARMSPHSRNGVIV